MEITTKQDILQLLAMPFEEFDRTVSHQARKIYEEQGNTLYAAAMLGRSNICKNQCLYCGMRAGNTKVNRYRMTSEQVVSSAKHAAQLGFTRFFLISGEDPGIKFQTLLDEVVEIKKLGLFISLACGEYSESQYKELKSAGADEYVIKFEMSSPDSFNRLNPSTNFKKRMECIENVKGAGMLLASGNIVDWPGQTDDELAEDILLMKKLDISWAPNIPYSPAMGTPLAAEGKRGDITKNLRQISILRIMMPSIRITAQAPGYDLTKGLSDEEGNLLALKAGGNILFYDLLPKAMKNDFSVVDNRNLTEFDHLEKMSKLSGMTLSL